jgi:hypothetical protein
MAVIKQRVTSFVGQSPYIPVASTYTDKPELPRGRIGRAGRWQKPFSKNKIAPDADSLHQVRALLEKVDAGFSKKRCEQKLRLRAI